MNLTNTTKDLTQWPKESPMLSKISKTTKLLHSSTTPRSEQAAGQMDMRDNHMVNSSTVSTACTQITKQPAPNWSHSRKEHMAKGHKNMRSVCLTKEVIKDRVTICFWADQDKHRSWLSWASNSRPSCQKKRRAWRQEWDSKMLFSIWMKRRWSR